jgi:hypothetical protein
MAAALAVAAVAQPDAQKMGGSSVMVFATVEDGKGGVNIVNRGGGFFIDSRHVVSNVEDCCGKTNRGDQTLPIAFAGKDDASAGKVIFSSNDNLIAILELNQAMNHSGVVLSPDKLRREGEPVYSVQYPKQGDKGSAQLVQGKLTGFATGGDKKLPMLKTSLEMVPDNAGGALFDACANAIGINLGMKDGTQFAIAIDPLIDALRSAGVQPNVTDQPCAAGGSGTSGGKSGSAPPPKREKEEQPATSTSSWRLPQGTEWVAVVIVVGLIVLALRPARKKIASAGASQPIPEPAPYPMQPYSPPQPYAPMQAAAMAPPAMPRPVAALKPVLRGIAGQYAGSSFPLETGSSTLGRDPSAANLVFSGEASSVSKRHCSVRWDAGRGIFLLEDHGSTNGTFLASGERLAPHQLRELRAGDRFYVGDPRNQFEVAMEP